MSRILPLSTLNDLKRLRRMALPALWHVVNLAFEHPDAPSFPLISSAMCLLNATPFTFTLRGIRNTPWTRENVLPVPGPADITMWQSSSFIDFHIASCSSLPPVILIGSNFAVRIMDGSSLICLVPRQFGNSEHPKNSPRALLRRIMTDAHIGHVTALLTWDATDIRLLSLD
jgi:hypothetical protein